MTGNELKKNMLVFGAGGQAGSEICKLFPDALGIHHSSNTGTSSVEITDYVKLEDIILKTRPEVIVNAVALTNVDLCETERPKALAINSESVKHIVRAARVVNSYVVHISTDYVFDGFTGMYGENSVPNPINYYGLSKLLGDCAALSYDDSLVVRTSGVFGYKGNYPRFVVNQLKENKEVKAVKSFYSPIHAKLLAEAILDLIDLRRTGIVNVAGQRVSRYDLAVEIAERMNVPNSGIHELDQSSMTWAAKRPFDSSLDCSLAKRLIGDSFMDFDRNLDLLLNI